jgi:hypothetical protein
VQLIAPLLIGVNNLPSSYIRRVGNPCIMHRCVKKQDEPGRPEPHSENHPGPGRPECRPRHRAPFFPGRARFRNPESDCPGRIPFSESACPGRFRRSFKTWNCRRTHGRTKEGGRHFFFFSHVPIMFQKNWRWANQYGPFTKKQSVSAPMN